MITWQLRTKRQRRNTDKFRKQAKQIRKGHIAKKQKERIKQKEEEISLLKYVQIEKWGRTTLSPCYIRVGYSKHRVNGQLPLWGSHWQPRVSSRSA